MKFAEAKLKADLTNYLDWSGHMKIYLTYYDSWEIITKSLDTESAENKTTAKKNNIKAYFIIES